MNGINEYSIKISKAENGFLLTREDIVSNKQNESLTFDEWETKLYVFPDTEGVIKYLQDNLK